MILCTDWRLDGRRRLGLNEEDHIDSIYQFAIPLPLINSGLHARLNVIFEVLILRMDQQLETPHSV